MNKATSIGTGIPNAHNRIHPTLPVLFLSRFRRTLCHESRSPTARTRDQAYLSASSFSFGNAFFSRRRDVVCAGTFKNILCARYFITIFRLQRNQYVALFYFSFVPFGLVVRDADAQ